MTSGNLVRIWTDNVLFLLFQVWVEREEGSRSKRCAFVERENLHKSFVRKAEIAVRGERMAQQRLYEAETEVVARNWEKRNSDIAIQEINQECELEDFNYNKQVSQRQSQFVWRIGIEK